MMCKTTRHLEFLFLLALTVIGLGACSSAPSTETSAPVRDYRIRVVTTPDGRTVALPPTCPGWATTEFDPTNNKPWDQLGCASARNLAAQVENPNDLIAPAPLSDAKGEASASAVNLYNTGKTKALKSMSESTSSSSQ